MTSVYNCIIVDDEQFAIELLVDRLSYLYKNLNILSCCTNWSSALDALSTHKCDILFLDISMPEKNGFSLLKLLPEIDCEIIFVTGHEQYALESFAFSPSGYVLKPIDDFELSAAINKALERARDKRKALNTSSSNTVVNDKIGIVNNQSIDYVNVKDIIYLESTNKCTKINTIKGSYTSAFNLGKFQHLIDQHSFFQVHRSYIVNLNHVIRYESSMMVIMSDKSELPVSRNVKSDFLKLFPE